MYNASEQFHEAVYANSPVECVLFRFADGVILTNEDIHMARGIKFTEAANLEEELTIGACPSASIEPTIMNYHGLLSGYAFGEAEVLLGTRTETSALSAVDANCVTYFRGVQITGHLTEPYLKFGGEAFAAQPGFPVYSIVIDGTVLRCISESGEVWTATISGTAWNDLAPSVWDDVDETTWDEFSPSLIVSSPELFDDFMTAKFMQWAAARRGLTYNAEVLYEYSVNGSVERYEYVKLGKFLINTPQKRKVNLLAATAYDRMVMFDVDASAFFAELIYPITLGGIFAALCAFVGVPAATSTFINSTRSFSQAPTQAEGITGRDILGWIAEAACTFARMTRDGEAELAWFSSTGVVLPNHFTIETAEYEVAPIDKLQILNSESDIGVIIGDGTNGYQIMDNPFLYGETDEEIRALGMPIYNRLSAFGAFSPVKLTGVCDWSIQAGDIISVASGPVTYSFPVYCQTITWKGNARVSYESTGAQRRPVMEAVNRRLYSQRRAIHEIIISVDGISSRLTGAEGNIASLELTVNGLDLVFVSKTGVKAAINASAEAIKIAAANISLEGVVTANSYFKVNLDGSMEAAAGKIGPWSINNSGLSGSGNEITPNHAQFGNWTFDNSGLDGPGVSLYNSGSTSTLVLGGVGIIGWSDGTIDVNGVAAISDDIYVGDRLLMVNPPTASGTANVRLVSTNSGYSLGIISSSECYKRNIRPIQENVAEKIDRVPAVTYEARSGMEKGHSFYGFTAEKMEVEFPWLVDYRADSTGFIRPESVQYDRVPAILWADAQQTHKKMRDMNENIANLEEKCADLLRRVETLEGK